MRGNFLEGIGIVALIVVAILLIGVCLDIANVNDSSTVIRNGVVCIDHIDFWGNVEATECETR